LHNFFFWFFRSHGLISFMWDKVLQLVHFDWLIRNIRYFDRTGIYTGKLDKSVMHGGPTYREILNIKIEKRAWEGLAFLGQNWIIERPTYRVCLCSTFSSVIGFIERLLTNSVSRQFLLVFGFVPWKISVLSDIRYIEFHCVYPLTCHFSWLYIIHKNASLMYKWVS